MEYDANVMGIAAKAVDDTIEYLQQNRPCVTEDVAHEMEQAVGRVLRRMVTRVNVVERMIPRNGSKAQARR